MGFINPKHLGLDPMNSVEPPKTIRSSGGQDSMCMVKFFAANCSVGDALTNQYCKVGGEGIWGSERSLMGTRPGRVAVEMRRMRWIPEIH